MVEQQELAALYREPSRGSILELNDVPYFAGEPGPGHYLGPDSPCYSSLGTQKLSQSCSSPNIQFSRTAWDSWSKVLISKGHSNSSASLGKVSTGHEYTLSGSLSGKSVKIGTGLRPDLSKSLGMDPHGSPGPSYNLRDVPGQSLGEGGAAGERGFEPRPQAGRRNKSQGLAERFDKVKPSGVGPGQYARKDCAIGGGRSTSMSTGRSAYDKVITPGWESLGQCRESPGPGPPIQNDIKQAGSLKGSIGKASRFPKSQYESCSPGPAAYNQDSRACGKVGKQHLSDTRTPAQMSFGNTPKKPRFRPLLAQQLGDRGGTWGYF